MWLTAPNRLGMAGWSFEGSFCPLEVTPGTAVTLGRDGGAIELSVSASQGLPELRDQYVRGDDLHLTFPQEEPHQFGIELCIRPLPHIGSAHAGWLGFEWMVSIQTTWLDSHPTVDLSATGARDSKIAPEGVFQFESEVGRAAVVLGRHDAPFVSVLPNGEATRLRLFGQFLEKGVIRRARPWVLLGHGREGYPQGLIQGAAEALAESPVPLT
ncbi:MAG: hypothetical protein AAFU85_01905 [Planctomycetota bacterium]